MSLFPNLSSFSCLKNYLLGQLKWLMTFTFFWVRLKKKWKSDLEQRFERGLPSNISETDREDKCVSFVCLKKVCVCLWLRERERVCVFPCVCIWVRDKLNVLISSLTRKTMFHHITIWQFFVSIFKNLFKKKSEKC